MQDSDDRAEILKTLSDLLTADCITIERHPDGTSTATISAKVTISEAGFAGPAQKANDRK